VWGVKVSKRIRDMDSNKIATLAGVSRSTVSRVINNYSNVPPETREKVMKIIQEYNYYPNISAQTLAGKKAKTIGLFVVDVEIDSVSTNYYYYMFIGSVIEQASALGYHVLTYIIKDRGAGSGINSIKEVFYQRRIDGGIFIGAYNHDPIIEELIAEGFFIGILDQDLPGRMEPNRVVCNVDNEASAENVVDYLVENNHRKIGAILGSLKSFSGAARYQGFLNGLKKHGIDIPKDWILLAQFKENISYEVTTDMLKKTKELPTAIIAANDNIAIGAIKAIQDFGLDVPGDISIIGFDDLITSAYFKPSLTTVKVDLVEMGRTFTSTFIDVIERNEKHKHVKMKFETVIVERESCRRIN
jgi:LacI family transcriptional regulator